ncbi:MAG: hypothetical protein IT581_00915 [Verrucomicrobiales bacterium]|nr:hypothetical protein [Verrucomicrobiales bacterium]
MVQPADVRYDGSNAVSLTVQVQSTSDVVFQWYRAGQALEGERAIQLQRRGPVEQVVGDYTLVAANAGGSVTSSVAKVREVPPVPPMIKVLSEEVMVKVGDPFELEGRVTGTPPVQLHWLKEAANLIGETNSRIRRGSAVVTDGGAYFLSASNRAGSVKSGPVRVTVVEPPSILSPATTDRYVAEGETLTLIGEVSGSNPMSFRWIKDGVTQNGPLVPQLALSPFAPRMAGIYSLVASNWAGSRTQLMAKVRERILPPTWVRQPTGLAVKEGEAVDFSAEASGKQMTYSWWRDGRELSIHTSELSLGKADLAMAGDYHLVAASPGGSITSQVARLRVDPAPKIVTVSPPPVEPPKAKPEPTVEPTPVNSSGATPVSGTRPAKVSTSKAPEGLERWTNSLGMVFVWVDGVPGTGNFGGCYVATTEFTWGQYRRVSGSIVGKGESVPYFEHDALRAATRFGPDFFERLGDGVSKRLVDAGWRHGLPAPEQFAFVANSFPRDVEHAVVEGLSGEAKNVASRQPDSRGIYDLIGNVAELMSNGSFGGLTYRYDPKILESWSDPFLETKTQVVNMRGLRCWIFPPASN